MRKKKRSWLIFLVVAILCAGCGKLERGEKTEGYASICVIDFDLASSADVGIESIGKKCYLYGKIMDNDSRYDRILSYLKSASPHKFEDSKVRAKIIFSDGRALYVNQMGQFLLQEESKKFNSDDFASFKEMMNEMYEVAKERSFEKNTKH